MQIQIFLNISLQLKKIRSSYKSFWILVNILGLLFSFGLKNLEEIFEKNAF